MAVGTILINQGMMPAAITSPVVSSLAMLMSGVVVPIVSLVSTQMSESHLSKVFGEEKSL